MRNISDIDSAVYPPTLRADEGEIRRFLTILHEHAAKVSERLLSPGSMLLTAIHPLTSGLSVSRFRIGDIEGMTALAMAHSETGHNVYADLRCVRADLKGGLRGGVQDTTFVLGLLIDNDADAGKACTLDIPNSIRVETSPGNSHIVILLNPAVGANDGKELRDRLRAFAVGADPATGSITAMVRVAGTPNFPGASKRARGRGPALTHIVSASSYRASPESLRAAFPAVPTAPDRRPREQIFDRFDRIFVKSALKAIPNSGVGLDYDEWFRTMCALSYAAKHSESEKTAEEFHVLADWWSEQSDKFRWRKQDATWKSIMADDRIGKPVITLGSLYKMAFEYGWDWPRFNLDWQRDWIDMPLERVIELFENMK